MSVLICIFSNLDRSGPFDATSTTRQPFQPIKYGDSGIHKYQFIHLNRRHADAQPLWTVKKLE